jgi:hypothetical protein
MDDNERAVAEGVKALLTEYANHVLDVERQFARDGLAHNRFQFQVRKQDTRRKIIVGGAVLAEARTNPQFGKELFEILSRRVTDERDRRLIAYGPSDAAAERISLTEPSEAEFTAEAERRLALTRPKATDQS